MKAKKETGTIIHIFAFLCLIAKLLLILRALSLEGEAE